MAAPINLVGRTFRRLQVLGRSDVRVPASGRKARERGWTLPTWECLCDPELGGCGSVVQVTTTRLRSGNTRSCGCLQPDAAAESGRRATTKTWPRECRNCGKKFVGTTKQAYCSRRCKEADAIKLPVEAGSRNEYLRAWKAERAATELAFLAAKLEKRHAD